MDILLASVIQQEMDIEVSRVESDFCVAVADVTAVDGQLCPGGNLENVWAYDDDGDAWGDILPIS